jgi:kynurenine formamidase
MGIAGQRAALDASLAAAKAVAQEQGPGTFPVLGSELLKRLGRIVDLSRPVFEGMPLWFGHQKTFVVTNQDHDQFRTIWKTDAGFKARNLILSEHAGTHVDAILEYDRDGPSIEQMPLEFFWGEAVCLDLSEVHFKNPDPDGEGWATTETIQRAEQRLADAGERIRAGDIVLCWFDYGDRTYPEQAYTDQYPGMSYDGAEYLAKKGAVNIGTDCIALDNSLDPQFQTHMLCKKYGIVNTESLANLGQLINRRFLYFGLPLNLPGGTGSPIRAFAFFPGE